MSPKKLTQAKFMQAVDEDPGWLNDLCGAGAESGDGSAFRQRPQATRGYNAECGGGKVAGGLTGRLCLHLSEFPGIAPKSTFLNVRRFSCFYVPALRGIIPA